MRVKFLSRYRNVNDYSCNGHRVSVFDDGTFSASTQAERDGIRLFELDRYADYLRWHADNKNLGLNAPLPFDVQIMAECVTPLVRIEGGQR